MAGRVKRMRRACAPRRLTLSVLEAIVAGMQVGPYSGDVAEAYRSERTLDQLAQLPELLDSQAAEVMHAGRNRLVRVDIACGDGERQVVVKVFGQQSAFQDRRSRSVGSKARRTWEAARHLETHGVGTPPPVAFLDRWENGRLHESYVLTEFVKGVTSFADELGLIVLDRGGGRMTRRSAETRRGRCQSSSWRLTVKASPCLHNLQDSRGQPRHGVDHRDQFVSASGDGAVSVELDVP